MRKMLIIPLIFSGGTVLASEAVDVAVSDWHGCALYDSGEVYCFGQIAGSEFNIPFTAYHVPDLPPAVSIAAGRFGACAIDKQGSLWCWGYDFQRSHRAGEEIVSKVPFQVEGLSKVRSVDMGYSHICAIPESLDVWCWGENTCGEVGCGHTDPVSEPTKVPYTEGVQWISAGVNNTCATFNTGWLVCWGSDNPTMPGKPFIYESPEPILMDEDYFGSMNQIANGRNFACGIRSLVNGEVTCWGSNIMGQLGTDTPRISEGPVGIGEVDGITNAMDIDATYFNACAVAGDQVICWGAPLFSDTSEMLQPPTPIEGLIGATRVAIGPNFGCAVVEGEVLCWGFADHEGKPIIEGMTPSAPVTVPGLPVGNADHSFDEGLEAAKTGDYALAMGIWWPLARQGDAEAQTALGTLYYNGWGVPRNAAEAVRLYRLAADKGFAKAQYYLGDLVEKGKYLPMDLAGAVHLYHLAALQGYAPAQYQLGVMYRDGRGTEKNSVAAHMWFSIASQNGEDRAGGAVEWLEYSMEPGEIVKAKDLAKTCMGSNYQDCG
ncbi:hypothetical protein [Tropicimonas aquimaris]|uniref:Beta-lactamase n=1 Tax=Tropicimonas aquimaris TaxID=914152 RepID=A0ABW3ITD7_9RHOB